MSVHDRTGRAGARSPYSVSLLQAAAALYGIDAARDDGPRPRTGDTRKTDKTSRE